MSPIPPLLLHYPVTKQLLRKLADGGVPENDTEKTILEQLAVLWDEPLMPCTCLHCWLLHTLEKNGFRESTDEDAP